MTSTPTIINDADHKQDFIITDCSIQIVEKDNVLFLTFNVGNRIVRYRVVTDTREPEIHAIRDFFETAKNESIIISEDLVRQYIFVESNGVRKQFTAQKL